MTTTTKTKPYVGVMENGRQEIFNASDGPTRELYGSRYLYVIGPFRTVRGAKFMRDYGRNNPHCQHVDDAERLAKHYADKPVFFAINRNNNTVAIVKGFTMWEQVQGAFRVGILMPDGTLATGIGQCKNDADFNRRLSESKLTLLS